LIRKNYVHLILQQKSIDKQQVLAISDEIHLNHIKINIKLIYY